MQSKLPRGNGRTGCSCKRSDPGSNFCTGRKCRSREHEYCTEETQGISVHKKTAIILGAVLLVVIIAAIILTPSKFERVENKCIQIAGQAGNGKNYFTLDTYPDSYEYMDETVRNLLLPGVQERTLEAIKYANDELGFPGVYDLMLKTTALMGRQSEENSKYKVSWSYHPDSGLEVMYQKK